MSNFHISFSHPWLLFLLLAAVLVTLIPHLRINKKYRRNRNRITSLVLHLIIMTLSILVLSGIKFEYTIKNNQNEIILLVDMTDSEKNLEENRDDVVANILDAGKFDGYKVGVVTFGFDQEYAVPLTEDVRSVYDKYKEAELPDTSATDIASALDYAHSLFTYPETSKIVLITDAKETDNKALNTIRAISANGTKVDVCYLNEKVKKSDVQIYDVVQPDTHITINNKAEFGFTLKSNIDMNNVTVDLYDNGVLSSDSVTTNILAGDNKGVIGHTFNENGLHEVKFVVSSTNDNVVENNTYITYINIEVFNKVLVLERYADQSNLLINNLISNDEYVVDLINYDDFDKELPRTVDELRQYDQVILNNISNSDLTEEFVDILYDYVNEYGGGLLTTAGLDEEDNIHAYNRNDLKNSKFESMLPVQSMNYTLPMGVMILIDTSDSMNKDTSSGKSRLQAAIDGALSVLESFTERDYVGVMTLNDGYGFNVLLDLTPVSRKEYIREKIIELYKIEGDSATDYLPSIRKAAERLNANKDLAVKHIVVISDGEPGDGKSKDDKFKETHGNNYATYTEEAISLYEAHNITTSFVVVGNTASEENANEMKIAAEGINGDHGGHFYNNISADKIFDTLSDDLKAPTVEDSQEIENGFLPVANELYYSQIFNGVELGTGSESKLTYVNVKLTGFTGTKIKSSDYLVLSGKYNVPIYAQMKFGNGSVGSLMIDVSGNYSSELLDTDSGVTLLKNIINNLMPVKSIRANDIDLSLKSDNYNNQLSIYTDLNEGEKIIGEISYISENGEEVVSLNEYLNSDLDLRKADCYIETTLNEGNQYSRCNFVLRKPGIYTITVKKINSNGEELSSNTIYKDLAYSKEYDSSLEMDDLEMQDYLDKLVERGKGSLIEDLDDPHEVFDSFEPNVNKAFDPRVVFMIIAAVLFLADVAVRKFKFKWLHELFIDKKKKEQLN